MSITIHFSSWYLPAAVTVFGFVLMILVGWRESKDARDYSIPLFTMLAFTAWVVATITCWTCYFLFR
jgi:hypothetical protein